MNKQQIICNECNVEVKGNIDSHGQCRLCGTSLKESYYDWLIENHLSLGIYNPNFFDFERYMITKKAMDRLE